MTVPFEQLKEPEYDIDGKVGYFHMYSHRKYYDDHKPFTAQEYESLAFPQTGRHFSRSDLDGMCITYMHCT